MVKRHKSQLLAEQSKEVTLRLRVSETLLWGMGSRKDGRRQPNETHDERSGAGTRRTLPGLNPAPLTHNGCDACGQNCFRRPGPNSTIGKTHATRDALGKTEVPLLELPERSARSPNKDNGQVPPSTTSDARRRIRIHGTWDTFKDFLKHWKSSHERTHQSRFSLRG
jgi:hypothetical protein